MSSCYHHLMHDMIAKSIIILKAITASFSAQCDHTASLDAFMQHFQNQSDESQPTYVSLLCCGCSTATIPVAEVSHYWNIPQVYSIPCDSIFWCFLTTLGVGKQFMWSNGFLFNTIPVAEVSHYWNIPQVYSVSCNGVLWYFFNNFRRWETIYMV